MAMKERIDMKVTLGGNKKMTIGNQPYEPIQAESSILIEKELDDKISDSDIVKLQDRISKLLDEDLAKKVEQTLKLQMKTRNRMKSILSDL